MLDSQRNDKPEMLLIHKAAIFIVSLLLIHNYFYTTTPIEVLIDNPHFSLFGPYNTSRIHSDDIYDKLIDIKNFSFKVNPLVCNEYQEGLLLVIIVASNPVNYENRKLIRNTWGQMMDSTRLVFLLGEIENTTVSQRIHNESQTFGDIVQGNFIDAYRNMTYKHVMGLKWVSHHCPMAKYVLKTDDDVVVNMVELRRFLSRELSPWGAKNLITCQVLYHAPVQRSKSSKWKVTTKEYSLQYYPTYCAGWSVLYSQNVIPRLLNVAQSIPYFWIDDVHITGIVAEMIGVARTPWKRLYLNSYRTNLLLKMGPEYAGQFLLGPPDLSVTRMSRIWKAIS